MNPSAKFDDLMLAMDAVDTLRHEASILEHELAGEDRKAALKARLKDYYTDQGIDVSDEVLETAIADIDKNRYVFKPLPRGLVRTLATAYVNRVSIALRSCAVLAGAAAVVVIASFGHYKLVTEPRAIAAAELAEDLGVRLPRQLEQAHGRMVAAGRQSGDEQILADADTFRGTGKAFIASGMADEARSTIGTMNSRADEALLDIQVKVAAEEIESFSTSIAAANLDASATSRMSKEIDGLRQAVGSGDLQSYRHLKRQAESAFKEIMTPLRLKIVDREGVRTGVWRTQDGGRTRVHYIVVEAVDPAGNPVPQTIRNVETGRTETVSYWAVRVPEAEYNRVGRDKEANGIVTDAEAGSKPAGSAAYEWAIPAVDGQMITRW